MLKSLDFVLKYPLIKAKRISEDNVIYEGKIFLNGKDYDVCIIQTGSHEGPIFNIDFNSTSFSNIDHESLLELVQCTKFSNIIHVLDSIKRYFEAKSIEKAVPNYSSVYRKVLYEYSEFTKFFLNLTTCSLSGDLSHILVLTLDEKNREHHVNVKVNFDESSGEIFKIHVCDLPGNKTIIKGSEVFKSNNSLIALFDEVLARIEYLQPYFDLMDAVDKNCSILDPEVPKKSYSYRRIWLGENLSIMITVNPENVFEMPDIKVLGLERIVDDIRAKLNNNCENWDPGKGPFQSLLDMLDICIWDQSNARKKLFVELESFPQKPNKEDKVCYLLVNDDECSICFCQRLNEKLPEILCKNSCCEKAYHAECLYEWLISVNSRRVFNEICGKCPNCEKAISCPIP